MTDKISFNDWKKLDIRVARVTSVEPHPNADKLFILKIDIGGEEKQIVAGIKEFYNEKELEGRQIIVFTNLEPAKLRGVESQAMLLAAVERDAKGKEKKVILLQPEKEMKEGSRIE